MQSLISLQHRAQNRLMHERPGGYGGSGWKRATEVLTFARALGATSILDYGCGEGTLKPKLIADGWEGQVSEYDPAITGKDDPPAPAELIVCTDVLEHVEPACLSAVLHHIHGLALKGVFLLVATRLANKTMPDGRNAHLIIEPANWWILRILAGWREVRHVANGDKEIRFWLKT